MNRGLTFIEVGDFSKEWKKARGTKSDLDRLKIEIERITGHDEPLFGNVSKTRGQIGNTGKSGGTRVAYFLHDEAGRVFLLGCYDRRKQKGFTKKQLKRWDELCKQIKEAHRE